MRQRQHILRRPAHRRRGGEVMSKVRILVVDDNPTNLKLVSDLLEWSGYQISSAVDAEQALEVIQQSPPDLILMDVALPGIDALTLPPHPTAAEPTNHTRLLSLPP